MMPAVGGRKARRAANSVAVSVRSGPRSSLPVLVTLLKSGRYSVAETIVVFPS
jgi:hypothetical protein